MIDRRKALTGFAMAGTAPFVARTALAEQVAFDPKPGAWRHYEITTAVDLGQRTGEAHVWVPVPAFADDDWIRPGETAWKAGAGAAAKVADPKSGAVMVHAQWREARSAGIEIVSRFSARDRAVKLGRGAPAKLAAPARARYLAATELMPLDGIVKETALKITSGTSSDAEKARWLYEWIVENTFRDPKTRGCGIGDVASMLKSGNLGGKCADLNALYVALARAAGLPARDIYGIRVSPSSFGYKSLGANTQTITRAQHCRAEVYLEETGWLPVDPADVRKVVLEEPPGNLAIGDDKVVAARKALFGAWETNWLAYNDAHDVVLPGSKGSAVPFLMYPQAEVAGERLDPLDPDAFKYSITAREISG